MRSLKTATFILLAIGWAPLTSHCSIGAVFGFSSIQCETEAVGFASHETDGDDGCDDSCCSVEFANYPSPRAQQTVTVPASTRPLRLAQRLTPTPPPPVLIAVAPPELPHRWQFRFRTALPPRAPSAG